MEMLVTMSALVILLSVATMGWQKTWRSQEILASATRLSQDLSLARSLAIKRGQPVQVRFYRSQDPNLTTLQPEYKTWQIVGYDSREKRFTALGEVQRFDSTVIMSRHHQFSSIVVTERPLDVIHDPMPSGLFTQISSIEFRPDGTTSLDPDPAQQSTLTLLTDGYADEQTSVPKDSRTLIIAAENGAATIY